MLRAHIALRLGPARSITIHMARHQSGTELGLVLGEFHEFGSHQPAHGYFIHSQGTGPVPIRSERVRTCFRKS